jgi:3-deoxy-D-manno-octulosonic-acid transferase
MAEEGGKAVDVVVVDQMGVLRRLYAICDLAFIGGSLVSEGGHNPLEAAAFEKPVIFGPDMSDFRQIAGLLSESGAAVRAKDTDQVYEAAMDFLSDSRIAEKAGKKGYEVLCRLRGAVLKTLEAVLKDV